MYKNIYDFIFSSFEESFNYMQPYLSNYQEFSKEISKQIQIKDNNNVQYAFDVEIDRIIINNIKKFSITGHIFSEESGFFEFGDNKYRVVYDPFCNSSLATRTFNEAAVGISIYTYNYEFITSAIMDFQTGILAIVENKVTNFYQIQSKEKLHFKTSKIVAIEDSWVVVTLENSDERKEMNSIIKMLEKPERLIISSGHIYWLKLAAGFIDAYLDPFGGERLYEMFASTVAQYSGCIVTNKNGESFDPAKYLKTFFKDPNYLYYSVAANSKELHKEIIKIL